MKDSYQYIIVGTSRGLGAALVNELLKKSNSDIVGISRHSIEKLPNYEQWKTTNRYHHLAADITDSEMVHELRNLCSRIVSQPLCLIFNAALVETELNDHGSINYNTFRNINQVGIDGFGNILRAVEKILLAKGGVFVGISSFSSLIPPVSEPRIAYPATKAYLNMALRCLTMVWGKNIDVVTIHLGHIGGNQRGLIHQWIMPSYDKTARKIVSSLLAKKIPRNIYYPYIYTIVYRFLFGLIPDTVYQRIFNLIRRFFNFYKNFK